MQKQIEDIPTNIKNKKKTQSPQFFPKKSRSPQPPPKEKKQFIHSRRNTPPPHVKKTKKRGKLKHCEKQWKIFSRFFVAPFFSFQSSFGTFEKIGIACSLKRKPKTTCVDEK